jgi:hypothetical protein
MQVEFGREQQWPFSLLDARVWNETFHARVWSSRFTAFHPITFELAGPAAATARLHVCIAARQSRRFARAFPACKWRDRVTPGRMARTQA